MINELKFHCCLNKECHGKQKVGELSIKRPVNLNNKLNNG